MQMEEDLTSPSLLTLVKWASAWHRRVWHTHADGRRWMKMRIMGNTEPKDIARV